MKVAYVGSCYSEEFLKYVLGDIIPSLRYYRVNSVSLMDEKPLDLGDMSGLTPETQRHLSYENRKDFRERMLTVKPDIVIIDFIRDVRCALLTDGEGYLSFPYELIAEEFGNKASFIERFDMIPFGSPEYVRLHRQALDRMCAFLNEELPHSQVLILNFPPTWDYRGKMRTKRDFRTDFMAWSARAPMLELMADYCAAHIHGAKLLRYEGALWSDDLAKYGPASVHYAAACWRLMASRFNVHSLSFASAQPVTVAEVGARLRAAFDACGEEADAAGLHWRALERSGADILTDLMPALLHEMEYRHGMNRRPNVIDAYNGFFWLLGRAPENMETLMAHATEPTLNQLRHRLLQSEEFKMKLAAMMPPEEALQ
ncbi:DUF6270 domain-containing protein [Sphingobium sp. HBC34]|uniref:DUF6270 domain-containing protein n=1 Tax=Sphingobium cyanobacteriorum TaxID=3063954 RepID=A0ABT8ZJ08_9SPHN|nr:DUF6270 domain-containing protein [Sphingobium sp. HBC34]MDO7833531.1 DUF6270 domain-containing protein [Sphingobium sp. HBC34]